MGEEKKQKKRACSSFLFEVVPLAGFEPARISSLHFECSASAYFATTAFQMLIYNI